MVPGTANSTSPEDPIPGDAPAPAPSPTQGRPTLLDQFAKAIQHRHEKGSWLGRALKLVSRGHLVLQLGFLLGLAGLMAGMSYIGERNLFLAFCLYVPTHLWLAPLLALFPLCLLTPHRLLCLGQIGLGLFLLGPYMNWRLDHPPGHQQAKGTPHTLTLLSNNIGQKGRESMSEFINSMDPDVMALQDAGRRAPNYLRGYPQFMYAESDNEFTLVSKYPILESAPLRLGRGPTGDGGQITANRSVIDFQGKRIAIYNVHMPTPRGNLQALMGPALMHGIISVPGTPWRENHDVHMSYWEKRLRLTRELRDYVRQEKLPYLIVGDFNMPHHGYLRREFSIDGLQDAHPTAGKGYGFTVPGATGRMRRLLTLGPWMRLDYVFASRQWNVRKCITEPKRSSQHRAVVAQLTLEPET